MIRIVFLLVCLLSKIVLASNVNKMDIKQTILIWDNDGTITGAVNPNDKTLKAKIILPGIKKAMLKAKFNFIISGFKSIESETQNFDPEIVASKFIDLMNQLPINAAAFSPAIGGITCYVIIKKENKFIIKKVHEDPKYKKYVGQFKKPHIGMFRVMRDIALEEFNIKLNSKNTIMIGDTWHDEMAARSFGIPFLDAQLIHSSENEG